MLSPDPPELEQQNSPGQPDDSHDQPTFDSDDEYFNISEDILHDELNPSRPPSPTTSVHDEPVEEPDEDESTDAPEPPAVTCTRRLRTTLDQLLDPDIEEKMLHVLNALEDSGLDVPLFLDILCWGRPCAVRNGRIRYARTALMCSDELPNIVQCCLKPPRWNSSTRKKRATGGRKLLGPIVMRSCIEAVQEEMKTLAPLLETDTATDVQAESLTGFTFIKLHAAMSNAAPTFVHILDTLSGRHPSPVIRVATIAQIMYRQNRRCNCLQKTYAVYFKFKGLSAKGFDVLHALGLVMSHTWISDAIRRMSKMTLDELRELVKKYPWVLTYDNVVILFKIFSQRLDNLQKLSSGTAGTVYVKPSAIPLPLDANARLKKQRALNLANPIEEMDVWQLAYDNHKLLEPL
ncbi:hypothetical protein C8F01DRAFT_1043623 [Mycena amicta]|nr:hypothetical protein C8F01DRAFT_1043623 [Mycena amicta]